MGVAGKNIVLGVCGSIAAFKVAGWVSALAQQEALVDVVMTGAAKKFITPLTFSSLSGRRVFSEMFTEDDGAEVMPHIELGAAADLLLVAPATANTIARLAVGMADDLLATTALVARCPKLIFPAMNPRMYQHPVTQKNLAALQQTGWQVVDPCYGRMACRDQGQGRLVDWSLAEEEILCALTPQDLAGREFLISAGPTREAIDPARFLSNRSSGKMGYALAKIAARRGAKVTLVSGPSFLPVPTGVELVKVESAEEMFAAVMARLQNAQVIIKAAAVSDYRPQNISSHKVKKENIEPKLALVRNPDILLTLGEQKRDGQVLVGFAAESRNLEAEGRRKLAGKNLDLIVVNNIRSNQAGFESDTNEVMLLDNFGDKDVLPLLSKEETASRIIDRIVAILP